MSYQVLARKWRPKSFPEMVGQEHVLRAMVNALEQGRLHHAYLFTGTRGVGKTTIARILAKSLNCDTGVTSNPCGVCSACREIDEGRFVDLIEVDAASRTKVEDTRELLENVQYAPTRGRYKVYLIDEVHMLSGHSFNALLKTLEEPPAHVKFLLATTDPQKLPITILSRCLQFSLKAMTPERIVLHLKKVLTAENVPFDEGALWALGRAAQGSMRDAMSLTDQAIAFGNGAVSETDVRDMLGTIDRDWVWRLLGPLADNNTEGLFQGLKALAEHSPDYSGVLADVVATLHRVATAQIYPYAVDDSEGDRQRVIALASQLTAEDVQLYYQLALLGRRDLPLAPDARIGFEMVLMRMMLFRPAPDAPISAGSANVGASKPGMNNAAVAPRSVSSAPMRANAGSATTTSVTSAASSSHTGLSTASSVTPSAISPASKMNSEAAAVSSSPLGRAASAMAMAGASNSVAQQVASSSPASELARPVPPASQLSRVPDNVVALQERRKEPEKPVTVLPTSLGAAPKALPAETGDHWTDLLASLGISGPVLNLARNCALEQQIQGQQGEETWQLAMSPRNQMLFQPQHVAKLEELLSAKLARTLRLKVNIREPQSETPDARLTRIKREKLEKAEAFFVEDPFVKSIIQEFSAVVERHSIRPADDITAS